MAEGERADVFLVAHGFAASRSEAQAAIRAGKVQADGTPVIKAAQFLHEGMTISYQSPHPYVSRGGVKMAAALDAFGYSPEGRICLDVGASTGGFTQVLLERGASRVYAVDVGHGQLSRKLASSPRIVSLEGLNARDLARSHIHEPVQAIVVDVSFISLKLVLPSVLDLGAREAWAVLLVKPQFERGRGGVGKDGVVKSASEAQAAVDDITSWISKRGWQVEGSIPSPILGGDGNREFLLGARPD